MNILLTSARSPAGLDLSRMLYDQGHSIFFVDSCPVTLCHFSRSTRKVFRVSPPNVDSLTYAKELVQVIKNNNIDLLIPLYEETFFIAKHNQLLKKYCRFLLMIYPFY